MQHLFLVILFCFNRTRTQYVYWVRESQKPHMFKQMGLGHTCMYVILLFTRLPQLHTAVHEKQTDTCTCKMAIVPKED